MFLVVLNGLPPGGLYVFSRIGRLAAWRVMV